MYGADATGSNVEPGRSPKCDLDDRRLWPFYARVQALDMTLIPQTSGLWGGLSIDFANPRHLEPIAEDFPNLRILAGHACYPYVREAIMLALAALSVVTTPRGLRKETEYSNAAILEVACLFVGIFTRCRSRSRSSRPAAPRSG